MNIHLDSSDVSSGYASVTGLNISGSGNAVNVAGGINIDFSQNEASIGSEAIGINIDGDNTLTLSGKSTVDMTTITGGQATLANVNNGGSLLITDDATIEVNADYLNLNYSTGSKPCCQLTARARQLKIRAILPPTEQSTFSLPIRERKRATVAIFSSTEAVAIREMTVLPSPVQMAKIRSYTTKQGPISPSFLTKRQSSLMVSISTRKDGIPTRFTPCWRPGRQRR